MFNQLIKDIIREETNLIPKLRKAFLDLESKQVNSDLLKISKVLSQNPEDYKSQSCQAAEIGKAVGKKQGELIEYFCANKKITGKSWTTTPAEMDIVHYKNLLWNILREILEIAGHPVDELAQEFGIKSKPKSKKKRIKNNSIDYDTTNTGGDF